MNECMRGCITERDFDEAERCFPGIAAFYRELPCKPATFLELVWAFLDAMAGPKHASAPDSRTSR